VVAEVEIDRNLEIAQDIPLSPLDLVVVRRIPNFDLIQTVTIEGEVKFPGIHALIDDNERIKSIIERAGGTTSEAFLEGVTLYREQESIGYVLFDFENAMNNKNSIDNLILKPGDRIIIPKQEDLVSIGGAIDAKEILPDKYIEDGSIDVVYHKGKRAMFYVKKYAGGVSQDGKRSKIAVEQANGDIDRTINFGLFKIYPKVKKGATITVGYKPPKDLEENQQPIEQKPIDWGQITSNAIAQLSAVLTTILLIERINN